MKELPFDMLPLAAEREMDRDWKLICDKYWHFKENAVALCLNAKEFPTSRQMKFISPRTGLEWHLIAIYPERYRFSAFYNFYTPYTNPKGKKGCYTIDENNCEKLTPHFLSRVCTRYLHPHGIFPKTLDEVMEAYCRHMLSGNEFLFFLKKAQKAYMVLKHGIAIAEVAGNGLVTYITFVTFDMLLDYQTPYQKVVERMFQLYREHGNHWHMEKFQKIISDEKLLPDGEDLQEVETKPHRKFTSAPKITGRLQNANKRDYDRAMQEIGSNSAKLWTPTMQRPGSMQWIDPAEMQKRVEELKKRR